MTSIYVTTSINLCLDVGHDKYFFLCNFGGRNMTGFEATEGKGPLKALLPPVTGSKKKTSLNKSQSFCFVH